MGDKTSGDKGNAFRFWEVSKVEEAARLLETHPQDVNA